jgi:hypothetical protein
MERKAFTLGRRARHRIPEIGIVTSADVESIRLARYVSNSWDRTTGIGPNLQLLKTRRASPAYAFE